MTANESGSGEGLGRTARRWVLVLLLACAACGEEPTGTYVHDWARMEPALLAALGRQPELRALSAEQRARALAVARVKLREELDRSALELELLSGGRFRVTCRDEAGAPSTSRGVWDLEGEHLTITTTHEDGIARVLPAVREGTWRAGSIRLAPAGPEPCELVLSRR